MFCPKCGKQSSGKGRFCNKCGQSLPGQPSVIRDQTVSTLVGEVGRIGKVLNGKFNIEAKLGSGRIGDVYRAVNIRTGSIVAIRTLHPHLAQDGVSSMQFMKDATLASQLRHRNVVEIHDVELSTADNIPFIAMDMAPGQPLSQLLDNSILVDIDFIVTVVAQVCSALDAAHKLGIMHHEIKPENIFLNRVGSRWQVKVLDFGLAGLKAQKYDSGSIDPITNVNAQHLPPEHFHGKSLDRRSDIFGIGVLLYRMLCGTVPTSYRDSDDNAAPPVNYRACLPIESDSAIHPEVWKVVKKALDEDPALRFQSAKELSTELISAAAVVVNSPDPQPVVSIRNVASDAPELADDASRLVLGVDSEAFSTATTPVDEQVDEVPKTDSIEIDSPASDAGIIGSSAEQDLNPLSGVSVEVFQTESKFVESEPPFEHFDDAGIFDEVAKAADLLVEGILETTPDVQKSDTPLPANPIAGLSAKVEEDDRYDVVYDETCPIPVPTNILIGVEKSEDPILASDTKASENDKARDGDLDLSVGTSYLKSDDRKPIHLKQIGVGVLMVLLVSTAVAGIFYLMSDPDPNETDSVVNDSNTSPQTRTIPDGMVLVEGGEFTMGHEQGGSASIPIFRTKVASFLIDKNETTNAEYKKFIDSTNHPSPQGWKNRTFPAGKDNFPVTGVTWDDANAYAKSVGKRLPTETEWEYAARGTTGFIYPWGNEWRPDCANAGSRSSGTVAVGSFSCSSPFGINDMVGNAWEWTASDAVAYEGGKRIPAQQGEIPKVIRGGNWLSSSNNASAVYRGFWRARNENDYTGTTIRCVKDL